MLPTLLPVGYGRVRPTKRLASTACDVWMRGRDKMRARLSDAAALSAALKSYLLIVPMYLNTLSRPVEVVTLDEPFPVAVLAPNEVLPFQRPIRCGSFWPWL